MQTYIQNSPLLTHQQFLKIIYDEIMTSSYGTLTFEDENQELLILTQQLTNYLVQNDQKFNTHLLKNMYKKRQELQTNFTTYHNLRQKYLNFLGNKQILTPFDNYDTEKWIVHFNTNYLAKLPSGPKVPSEKASTSYKQEFETYNQTIEFYNSFSEHINTYLLHLNKIFITQDFLKQIEKINIEIDIPKVPSVANIPEVLEITSTRQVLFHYNFDFEQHFNINLDQ